MGELKRPEPCSAVPLRKILQRESDGDPKKLFEGSNPRGKGHENVKIKQKSMQRKLSIAQ